MKLTMMDYIRSQPEILKRTYQKRVVYVEPFLNVFRRYSIKKLYVTGSGTSYHTALLAKRFFETFCQIETCAVIPTILELYEKINVNGVYHKDEIAVLAISQTGTSYSTMQALQRAHQQQYLTMVFTQDTGSEITRYADVVLPMQCEKELIPAETQGYTSAVLALYCMATALQDMLGCGEPEPVLDITDFTKSVRETIRKSEDWFQRNAYEFLMMQKLDLIGYGVNHVTALEGALKLTETTKRKTAGYEMEEFIHGSEMGYDHNNYAVIIASDEYEYQRSRDVKEFLQSLTDHVFIISNLTTDEHPKNLNLDVTCSWALSAILYVIAFQVLSARMCEQLCIDNTRYPHDHEMISHTKDTQFRN